MRDFGVRTEIAYEQLVGMMAFTDKIEYIEIRSEDIRIPWVEITDKPDVKPGQNR